MVHQCLVLESPPIRAGSFNEGSWLLCTSKKASQITGYLPADVKIKRKMNVREKILDELQPQTRPEAELQVTDVYGSLLGSVNGSNVLRRKHS
jgi:hypothetical protein